MIIHNHYNVAGDNSENRRGCRLCWCFPSLSSFFICCRWMGTLNTSFWTILFAIGNVYFAARCWGTWYAGLGSGVLGAALHGLLFVLYLQAMTLGESVGPLTHLVSMLAVVLRAVWWK